MLDEYWKYSIFSGVMILLFEGVTVFTRLKSMRMIRGMGNKSKELYVYR
jgi:cation-transporting ATPase 13A1